MTAASETMVEKAFTVRSELGLHARPAGRFVRIAAHYDSEIEVGKGDDWVSGRSVLSILSLAAVPGTILSIRAVGADAEEAVEALGAVVEALKEPSAGV